MYMGLIEEFRQKVQSQKYIPQGATLVIAVSGGVDSVVLLHLLLPLSVVFNWELMVAHLDHGLREASKKDCEFVKGLAESFGLRFLGKMVDVKKLAKSNKQTIEEAGREVRYKFFNDSINKYKASAVVVAHTMDDQLETIVMNFARGASYRGLAGMSEWENQIWRPLLSFAKADLVKFAKKYHIKFREDKSNQDVCFTRNKVRHMLLPKLKLVNPGVDQSLIRNAEIFKSLKNYLDNEIKRATKKVSLTMKSGAVIFNLKKFLNLPDFLQSEIIFYAIELVKGDRQDVKKIHLDEIYKVVNSSKKQSTKQLMAKLLLTKTCDKITISRSQIKKK